MPVLRGRIVDSAGNPVAGARVMVTDGPAPVPDVALLAGPDGDFVLAVPVAGRWRLLAVSDNGRAEATADVGSGAAETSLALTLKPD